MKATADHGRWRRTLPAQGSDRGFGALQPEASRPPYLISTNPSELLAGPKALKSGPPRRRFSNAVNLDYAQPRKEALCG